MFRERKDGRDERHVDYFYYIIYVLIGQFDYNWIDKILIVLFKRLMVRSLLCNRWFSIW